MAVVIGTISKFGQSNGSYPWTFTTAATINSTGAEALLVAILNSNADKPTPTVKFGGAGGVAMTLIASRAQGNGRLFLFGLMAPAQTATGSLYINNPNANGDNTNVMVLPLSNVDLVNPWGAVGFANGANGVGITATLLTTAAGSTVFGFHSSVYGPGLGGMNETGVPAITQVDGVAVDGAAVFKLVRHDIAALGGSSNITASQGYADHMIYSLEVKGSSGPPKNTLTVPGIDNTPPGMGLHLAKDPNSQVGGPLGIDAVTTAFGPHTVTRQTVVYYDRNGLGNVASGTPATIVERVSEAANYRISRSAVGVQPGEKKYYEVHIDFIAVGSAPAIGVGVENITLDMQLGGYQSDAISWDASGGVRDNNTGMNGRSVYSAGATLMVAIDGVNGWIFFGMNGVWYNGTQANAANFTSGDGRANNNPRLGSALYPMVQTQMIGDKTTTNFGKQAFAYAPPAGYTALDAGAPVGPVTRILTAPSIVADVSILGSHLLNPQVLLPGSIAPIASVLGSPSVVYVLRHSGLLNTSLLGAPLVLQLIKPSGLLAPASVLGSHTALVGAKLYPTGIPASGTALGLPGLVLGINLPSIVNESFLGTPRAGWLLVASSIVNDTQLGEHLIANLIEGSDIYPLGIVNLSAFGLARLNQEGKAPGVEAEPSVLGDHIVLAKYEMQASGIYEPTQYGIHTLVPGVWTLSAESIINEHYFGNHAATIPVLEGDIFIKDGVSWKAIDVILSKYQGRWYELDAIYEKIDGVWVRIT